MATSNTSGGGKKAASGAKKTPAGGDQDKPKLVVFKKKSFKLPELKDVDILTLDALQSGQVIDGIKGLLGAEGWKELAQAGAKLGDLEDVMSQIAKAYGFEDVGESGAS